MILTDNIFFVPLGEIYTAEAHLKPCQTSMVEYFAKTVRD